MNQVKEQRRRRITPKEFGIQTLANSITPVLLFFGSIYAFHEKIIGDPITKAVLLSEIKMEAAIAAGDAKVESHLELGNHLSFEDNIGAFVPRREYDSDRQDVKDSLRDLKTDFEKGFTELKNDTEKGFAELKTIIKEMKQ